MFVFLVAGCGSTEKIDSNDLKKIKVQKTTNETTQDDFIFRLVSEKEQYKVGENVTLYGEILYKGNKEKVTINHSSSAIFFDILEDIRGYKIDYLVNDIGISTTLNRLGNPYQTKYKKSAAYSQDDVSGDYLKFMDEFLKGDGFPPGYYIVKGTTDFSVAQKRYNIETTIDFKVVD